MLSDQLTNDYRTNETQIFLSKSSFLFFNFGAQKLTKLDFKIEWQRHQK